MGVEVEVIARGRSEDPPKCHFGVHGFQTLQTLLMIPSRVPYIIYINVVVLSGVNTSILDSMYISMKCLGPETHPHLGISSHPFRRTPRPSASQVPQIQTTFQPPSITLLTDPHIQPPLTSTEPHTTPGIVSSHGARMRDTYMASVTRRRSAPSCRRLFSNESRMWRWPSSS